MFFLRCCNAAGVRGIIRIELAKIRVTAWREGVCLHGQKRNTHTALALWLLVAGVVAAVMLVCAVGTFAVSGSSQNFGTVEDFNTGWTYEQDGRSVAIPTLPAVLQLPNQEGVKLTNTLPQAWRGGYALCVKTVYQSLWAYVDGQLVYSHDTYNQTAFGQRLGRMWNIIHLSDANRGKPVQLVIQLPYAAESLSVGTALLGNESAIITQLFAGEAAAIGMCLFLGLLAVGLFLAAALLRKRYARLCRLFCYLGLFLALSATWIFTDSSLQQFFFSNQVFAYLLSFFCFMLFPIPFVLFLREACERSYRILDALALAFCADFILNVCLYLGNVCDLPGTVLCTHLLLLVTMGSTIVICFKELRRQGRAAPWEILLGTAILVVFAVIALVHFYTPGGEYSRYYRIGLLLFALLLVVRALRKGAKIVGEGVLAATYRKLAYTDPLTDLGSRAAFSEEVQRQQQHLSQHSHVAFVVLDLNDLKQVNDTRGHSAGDALLCATAECLRRAFEPKGKCYRIGGDEFVVILVDQPAPALRTQLQKMRAVFAEYNSRQVPAINIAYGVCVRETAGAQDSFVLDVFNAADAKMYTNKQQTKYKTSHTPPAHQPQEKPLQNKTIPSVTKESTP